MSTEISTDTSVDISTDILTNISQSIYRSSISRYVDRYSTDMSADTSTDTSVEGCTKYTWSIYLCLLFIATVFTLAWLKNLYLHKILYKSNRNELNFAVECGLPVKDRLFFELSEFYFWIDTCNRNKCHATHLHLHESCCFSCNEISLSAFQVWKMNLIIVESNKMWQNIPDTLCFQLPTSGINVSSLLDLLITLSKSCQYLSIYILNLTP